jgi:hypothetical protein
MPLDDAAPMAFDQQLTVYFAGLRMPAEKKFLMPYILEGENSCNVSIYDGVANGLRAKAIIYRASDITIPGVPGMLCPHNMQPYARALLNKHRRLLK